MMDAIGYPPIRVLYDLRWQRRPDKYESVTIYGDFESERFWSYEWRVRLRWFLRRVRRRMNARSEI